VRRRKFDPDQIDGGDAVIFRACIVRVSVAAAAATLALILGAAIADAQAIRIPNSEMPGRERERFVDPPAPKSQPGAWLTAPINQAAPGACRGHPRLSALCPQKARRGWPGQARP
jgi:hypothetical protein